jgi:amino acid transporter
MDRSFLHPRSVAFSTRIGYASSRQCYISSANRRLWRWHWVIPVLAILVLGYTLYSNIYPVPAPPFNIFPYVALAWLVVGLLIVLISPALVRSIGLHLEENEGLRVEEHAGPVP